MRFYRVKCSDCTFDKVCRSVDKAEQKLKGHEGQSGHIVMLKGPFYESGGSNAWTCTLCDFRHKHPEMVEKHVDEEHDTTPYFIKKTSETVQE